MPLEIAIMLDPLPEVVTATDSYSRIKKAGRTCSFRPSLFSQSITGHHEPPPPVYHSSFFILLLQRTQPPGRLIAISSPSLEAPII